ncbi:MAG: tryptophan--tRNA ligase [Gammaproteobacteria bacterium]|nr:tryptophan--tRNA ligase [Gammaproteobacteria bacterium]
MLSGMRPTGLLHLGHFHGVLKNWIKLQESYDCLFFVADWHALTTHYEEPQVIGENVLDMVIDWLAAGVDPDSTKLFVQSRVPEHAELHLLLSMITPLGWLERVPSYKDQQDRLKDKDLATYGFLGYPLLQSADILIYKAGQVPVGEDQVAHVELTREVARRFNHLFGREADFEDKIDQAIRKMGKRNANQFRGLRRRYREQGDQLAIREGQRLLQAQQNISGDDRERLMGALEGVGRVILPEPQALLTKAPKMPGLDGQKMSKSYHNTISLRESPKTVEHKIRTMPTDPARVRRTDPGEPAKCPVWQLHQVYSDSTVQAWVEEGCRTAGIGCLDCKRPVIESVLAELEPLKARAEEYARDMDAVKEILSQGTEAAREIAQTTLDEVRSVMGLSSL